MRHRIIIIVALIMLVTACGDDATTVRAGGAEFTGTFDTGPGFGPGEISFVLDDTGDRIVSAVIDPALNEFTCPTGVTISGGGLTGTYTPGIAIQGNSFDNGTWSGTFDSSTEAHGSYDLQEAFDCPYLVTWAATSE